MLILADARGQIADFLQALILVYTLIIFAYIVSSMFLTVGGRIPYSRVSRAILDFLRDVTEPYLAIFRRVIPPMGPLDLSPMIATIVLWVVGGIIVGIIRG